MRSGMSEYYGFDVGSGYAFQAPGWKQSDFLLCDLQEVVRQSDQAMVDAAERKPDLVLPSVKELHELLRG